jgi:hypothetical protein
VAGNAAAKDHGSRHGFSFLDVHQRSARPESQAMANIGRRHAVDSGRIAYSPSVMT